MSPRPDCAQTPPADGLVLAIETALSACSVALGLHGEVLASRHEIIERGHAERLVPMIRDCLADVPRHSAITRAAVIVDVGPGSFTGIRIGVAAARAFALAWQVPVMGYTSLEVIAAARPASRAAVGPLMVAIDARRGDVYAQLMHLAGADVAAIMACPPAEAAQAAARAGVRQLAGSGAGLVRAAWPVGVAPESQPGNDLWPDARQLLALHQKGHPARPPSPLYVRGHDAQLPDAQPSVQVA